MEDDLCKIFSGSLNQLSKYNDLKIQQDLWIVTDYSNSS